MKISKIALAAAIIAASSSASMAQQSGNSVSIDTDVLVYVAAGLSVEVTRQMKFSDIVVPTSGSGTTTGMSMDCKTGDVTYANAESNPNGPAGDVAGNGAANAKGNKQVAQVGQVEITGEHGYAISVEAAVGAEPQGVTFTPWLGWGNGTGSIKRSLGADGRWLVDFCGSVTVDDTVTTGAPLSVPVAITISYR